MLSACIHPLQIQAQYVAKKFIDVSTLVSRWTREEAVLEFQRWGTTDRGCNIVLRFENLATEFRQLMAWMGLALNMSDHQPLVSPYLRGDWADCLTPEGARNLMQDPEHAAKSAAFPHHNLTTVDSLMFGYLRSVV